MFCLCADGFEGKNCETGKELAQELLSCVCSTLLMDVCCCFSQKWPLLRGLGAPLQRNGIPLRERPDLPGLGPPNPRALPDLWHQLRETQLLQVGLRNRRNYSKVLMGWGPSWVLHLCADFKKFRTAGSLTSSSDTAIAKSKLYFYLIPFKWIWFNPHWALWPRLFCNKQHVSYSLGVSEWMVLLSMLRSKIFPLAHAVTASRLLRGTTTKRVLNRITF